MVFRVVPVGLGNGTLTTQMAKGGAAAVVPGIAPRKPSRLLLGSLSAPSLTNEPKLNMRGEREYCTTSRTMEMSGHESSRRDGQMPSRSAGITQSNGWCDSDGSRNGSGGRGSLARKSASVGRLPSTVVSEYSSGSNHRSGRLSEREAGWSREDSPEPAHCRADVQLESDKALVRSLD